MKRGVLLTLAYDGRPFSGFAVQPRDRTIAGELLRAIVAIDPSVRYIRGASRTDAGVHARGQRVAFDAEADLPMRGWSLAINRHLPDEIGVRRAARVEVGFTPRFRNRGKRYRYTLLGDRVRDPFLEGRVWRLEPFEPTWIERARAEAKLALGTHDFGAFRSSADARERTTRTLRSIEVEVDSADPRLVHVDVEGDAFLHNMVRILVGTISDVARGRIEPGAITRAIASGDRTDCGITAPPDGLCLVEVKLEDEGTDAWPPEGYTSADVTLPRDS